MPSIGTYHKSDRILNCRIGATNRWGFQPWKGFDFPLEICGKFRYGYALTRDPNSLCIPKFCSNQVLGPSSRQSNCAEEGMNQAAIMMDPMHPRIQLNVFQTVERKLLDVVKGLTFVNKNKDIV